jgi:hypothetical protein
LLLLAVIGALAGCAEVTLVRQSDGSAVYLIDCGNTMPRLESCRGAMEHTCPDGYEVLPNPVVGPGGNRPVRDAGVFRCTPSAPVPF